MRRATSSPAASLRSERAAKKLLLDHLARYGADWRPQVEVKSCEPIAPDRDPFKRAEMKAAGDALFSVRRFFWKGREYIKMDWEASSASYLGPVIRVNSNPDNQHDAWPVFDERWRVEINVSVIRINAAPIITALVLGWHMNVEDCCCGTTASTARFC